MKKNKIGKMIGTASIFIFIICMFWGFLLSTPELKKLHTNLLKIFYPGFNFNTIGIIIGLIESYIYGWIAGTSFVLIYKQIKK